MASNDATVKVVESKTSSQNFFWQQTMLRIKDPSVTLPFYEKNFGFSLIDKYDFPQWKFSLFFMAHLPPGMKAPTPGTEEAHTFLWNTNITTLELTHNHGTESQPDLKHNNGNVEPHRGFGHIAVLCDDVYKATDELLAAGVSFHKKPDDGRMKGLAFALDPDGYWIEIIKRTDGHKIVTGKYNLAQTMLRTKDPKASMAFFRDLLGMELVEEKHFGPDKGDFSLYFLCNKGVNGKIESGTSSNSFFHPVLELTHNHGTESKEDFSYHNGNDEPKGFGHIGFLVDDVHKACADLEAAGVKFKKMPNDGNMNQLAFAYSPVDNYWIEIVQRGMVV